MGYFILTKHVQYLIYTEFNNIDTSNIKKKRVKERGKEFKFKASASKCSEHRLIERLHGILYSECYARFNKAYCQISDDVYRQYKVDAIRKEAICEMQNDLQLIIEKHLVTKTF